MKKILSILLALCLFVGAVPISAGAAGGTSTTFVFDANGGSGNMEPVVVPNEIGKFTFPLCTLTPPPGMAFDYWEFDENQVMPGVVVTFEMDENYAVPVKAVWKTSISDTVDPDCEQMFNWVNQERVKAGLPPCRTSTELNDAANQRAKELAELSSHMRPNGTYFYTALDERGIQYASAAENLFVGASAQGAMSWWMSDPPHRANILSSICDFVGIGHYRRNGVDYWIQDFCGYSNLLDDSPYGTVVGFQDVKISAYYANPVLWAVANSITKGVDALRFGPAQTCTREQIVTFLWRAAGSPEPSETASFRDMPTNSEFCKAISWAVENGITGGTGNNTFSPSAGCTRVQAVTFIWRAAGKPEPIEAASFSDMPAYSQDFCQAISWAVENGVTHGTGNNQFSPDQTCRREHIVTFLYNAKYL